MDRPVPLFPEPVFETCSFGLSRLRFRAQAPVAGRADIAVLGSGLSFGRFVRQPWPALLAAETGARVRNLAVPQTGPEAWRQDPEVIPRAREADLCLLELPGLMRLSTPYWQLHPRRNDRIIRPLPALSALYPEVDSAGVHFTGHLLRRLEQICPERFRLIRAAAQQAWTEALADLLQRLPGPVLLLSLTGLPGRAPPPDPGQLPAGRWSLAEVAVRPPAGGAGPEGCFPDQASHHRIAEVLAQRLRFHAKGRPEAPFPTSADPPDQSLPSSSGRIWKRSPTRP